MRRRLAIASVLALLVGGLLGYAVRGELEPTYQVRQVIDGDTIEIVDAGGIRTRVRFRSVDAPELDEPGGLEAKAALEEQLLGQLVHVTPYARDRYGRLIADVRAAGEPTDGT